MAAVALLAGCGDPAADALKPTPPLSIRLLPGTTLTGGQVECSSPLVGSPNPQLWTVRLRVYFDPDASTPDIDRTLIQTALRTIDFPDIPRGEGYRLEVDLCSGPERSAAYTGQARAVDVSGGGEATTVDVYLLPVDGFACPGTATEPSWPDTPHAFGAMGGASSGDKAVLAGGASEWFGTVNPVPGTDAIAVFDRVTGTFSPGAATLPSPRLMSHGVVVRDPNARRERLLVLGGVASLVPFGSRAVPLLQFGPPADDSPLPGPVWVDLDGVSAEPLVVQEGDVGHLARTFAFGVGSTRAEGSAAATWVVAAGGVEFSSATPARSTSVTFLKFTDTSRGESAQLDIERIAPGVIAPLPGIVAVVGGHDDNLLAHLIEVFDLTSGRVVHRQVEVDWKDGARPARSDLAVASAFPHVIALQPGSFLVIGGAPILERTADRRGSVILPADRPVLYRIDLTVGETVTAAVSVPDELVALASLAERTFATELAVSDGEVWLIGGMAPVSVSMTNFTAALGDVVVVDRRNGTLRAGGEAPWPAFGASAAPLWGGVSLLAGGVTPSGNTPVATNAAALLNRQEVGRACGALDEGQDVPDGM